MKQFSQDEWQRLLKSKQRDVRTLKDVLSLLDQEMRSADRALLCCRFLDFPAESWHQIDFNRDFGFIHDTNMDIVPVLKLLGASKPLDSGEIESLRLFCLNSERVMLDFIGFLVLSLAKRSLIDPSVLLMDILWGNNGSQYAEHLLRPLVAFCPCDIPDALLEELLGGGSRYTGFLVKLCGYLKNINDSTTREALIGEFASWAKLPDFEHFALVVDLVGVCRIREDQALPRLYLRSMLRFGDFRNVELLLPLIVRLQSEDDFEIARTIIRSSNRAAAHYVINVLGVCNLDGQQQ